MVLGLQGPAQLCARLFMLGALTGLLSGGILFVHQRPLTHAAIRDVAARRQLQGWVWPLVCLCQPINAGAGLGLRFMFSANSVSHRCAIADLKGQALPVSPCALCEGQ
jgi:hypothetical protein